MFPRRTLAVVLTAHDNAAARALPPLPAAEGAVDIGENEFGDCRDIGAKGSTAEPAGMISSVVILSPSFNSTSASIMIL